MNIFHVPANLVDRLGWVLVHSAWQFTLIALVALLLVQAARRCSAASRYWMLLLAFAAMVASPVVTLLVISVDEFVIPVDESIAAVAATAGQIGPAMNAALPEPVGNMRPITGGDARELPTTTTSALSWQSAVDRAVRPWLSVIVGIWCLGVLAFAWRPLLSWHTVRRLRSVGVSPVPADVAAMLRRTADRLRVRQAVQILQSTLTRVPVVIGYLRPVILLPVSVISGVPTSQLEAILAHELAHVRRHDFLVNLLQTLVETLFFYHPAVWWLSHRIRVERENCCDDLAVAALGSRVEYGRALLALEELRGTTTALALGVRGGSLLDRVRRLFGRDPAERSVGAGVVVGVGLLALVIIAVGVWSSTQADDDGTTPGATAKLDGGIEIKLLGVSYQPSENQPWWTPEGAVLPGDPLASRWKSGKTRVHDEGEHRELALEVTGAEGDVHALVDFAPGETLGLWSTFWNVQDDDQNKKKVTLIRAVSAGFPKDQKQRDVLVRLAVAPWQPYEQIDLKRAKPGEKTRNGSVEFRQVQERTDGTTQVDLAFPANFELRANHEVVGEDLDGHKVVLSGTTIADAGARGWIFPCPLDRLVRVRVRFRWYTHEVTFRDVSLHPGHVTKVKAKVTKLDPPPDVSLDVFAPVADEAYARPTADDQRATATIPAEAWGQPVDGLRVAIALRTPPIDKDERLCYDIVVENVSDHDILFSAEVGVSTWHYFFKAKLVDADGKQVAQQAGISFLGGRLTRIWLKPKERCVIFSWASRLFKLDAEGKPLARPEEYLGFSHSSFSVKPGRYSLSAAVELGPGWSSVDPISKKRTVLSPAPGEWSGKLQTGAVPVALFTQPAPADEAAAKYPPIEFRRAVAAGRQAMLKSERDKHKHPPIEFRVAVSKADRDADGVAWFPIIEPRTPGPAEQSGANVPIEEKLDEQWRGLLWDKAEHTLLADGTWRVVKCEVVPVADANPAEPHFSIQFTLDAVGGAALRRLTKAHSNQSLAIVVDGTIVVAPVIRSEIGESVEISGNFTREQADKLAATIRGGNADGGQPLAMTAQARIVHSNDLEMRVQQAGTIVSLKVGAGAKVKKNDVLAVVNNAESSKPEDIVAPLDGEVVKVFVRDGEQVKAGQGILRIVQLDQVVVESELKLADLLPRGLIGKVEISLDGKDTFEFPGKVTFIDPKADASGNHRIRVEVENRQQDGKWLLVPGQLAKLTILSGADGDGRKGEQQGIAPLVDEVRAIFVLRFAEAKSAIAALKAEAAIREIRGFEATIDPRLNTVLIIADADTLKALQEILDRLDSKNAPSTVFTPADLGPEYDGKEVTMIFKIIDTQLIGGEREGEFPHVKLHYVGMQEPPYLGVYVKGELADVLHRSACVSPDDKLVGRSIKASGRIKIHKDFPKGEDQTPAYFLDLRDWKKFQILPESTGK